LVGEHNCMELFSQMLDFTGAIIRWRACRV